MYKPQTKPQGYHKAKPQMKPSVIGSWGNPEALKKALESQVEAQNSEAYKAAYNVAFPVSPEDTNKELTIEALEGLKKADLVEALKAIDFVFNESDTKAQILAAYKEFTEKQ